ncbi:MAG TPA: hypothetical protein PKO15_01620 [Fibrobacteria bacterium]|nr:hypothetical protein [Fibrobacteria bacterium]
MARILEATFLALSVVAVVSCDRGASRTGSSPEKPSLWSVDSELASLYGPLPGSGKASRPDSLETRVEVCLRKTVRAGVSSQTWVAVCGNVLEAPHAQTGWVDLLVFSDSAGSDRLVGQVKGLESGSFGVPGEVSLVRIGAHRHAFALSSSYMGMGSMIETVDWYGWESPRLRPILSTRLQVSNEGEIPCEEDSLECRWEHRRLVVDSSDPRAGYFPIVVEDSARSDGAFLVAGAKVAFQEDSARYPLPEPLVPDFWER